MTSPLGQNARNQIERVLLEHPDVMGASVQDEEAPDGRRYAIAYVVPHVERMNAARSRILQANRERRITQWKTAFDHTYRSSGSDNAPGFVGWKSSFSNATIPEAEMQEWLDRTVERVAALTPDRILEIGCGIGLLVRALAPKCRVYRGTDLSPIAIGRLREFVSARPDLCHVELAQREATDLGDLPPESIDLAMFNSVVQYFPDLDYLQTVLERAAGVVASGGHIFVGDVRHLGLLNLFHGAVQFAKAPPAANLHWLRRKISLAIGQERELVIDPRFFLGLATVIPRITRAEILLKRGPTNNELTRYRYDVLLHIDDTQPCALPAEMEWQAGDDAAADLVSRFKAQGLPAVRIVTAPNGRVGHDLAVAQLLASADARELVGDLRRRAAAIAGSGLDPDSFWQLSDTPECDVRVGWSPDSSEGRFDVVLVDRRRWRGPPPLLRAPADRPNPAPGALATDPIAAAYLEQLGLDLGKVLRERLAGSPLPAAVLAVRDIPPVETRPPPT